MSHNYQDSAVVFIDVINDFQFDGADKLITHTEKILPNMVKLKKFANDHHIPVIYVNDHYGVWQADLHQIIEHCTNETSKHVIEQLRPTKDDYFFDETPAFRIFPDAITITIAGN
ncbi:isochorismatase family protein [Virgibacillus halophilus]|uniref:Isochorismatase family protein n=1 Tax=Tigheibacillus halophilus TaxID=361280 RepID=A0ABU5C657_9BACI|nr:isochorismatase family protein [Virgibacillus halophilus]